MTLESGKPCLDSLGFTPRYQFGLVTSQSPSVNQRFTFVIDFPQVIGTDALLTLELARINFTSDDIFMYYENNVLIGK